MRAGTPHECVAIHSYTFLSEEFVSTCRVPSYKKFLRTADLKAAYAWEKRFLERLPLENGAKRWVLKSPDHVHGLEALFGVFPDAVIIQTHRNPLQVLRSSAELTRVLRRLYGRPGDLDQLAMNEAQVLAEGTERAIRFRDNHPELADRFIDLKYSEVVSDPLAAVSQIYRRMDIPLTTEAIGRMKRLASSRTRYRRSGERPHAQDLRLAAAAEMSRFKQYCSRFGLSYGDGV
jgi:hypothetical protein